MYKIVFYVPEAQVEDVKNVLFAVGAGRLGNYSHCCWQVLGQGQFMAHDQATPFCGEKGQVHQEKEYYVELICPDSCIEEAIAALIAAHPYEEPAYQAWKLAYPQALG